MISVTTPLGLTRAFTCMVTPVFWAEMLLVTVLDPAISGRRRGLHGYLGTDIERCRNAVGGDQAGLGKNGGAAMILGQIEKRQQFLALPD